MARAGGGHLAGDHPDRRSGTRHRLRDGAEAAFGVVYGLYTVLSALGGLWMPISIMPAGMQTFGKLLPSYRAADLGWHIAFGKALDYSSVLYLLAWTAVFAVIALYFSRRAVAAR